MNLTPAVSPARRRGSRASSSYHIGVGLSRDFPGKRETHRRTDAEKGPKFHLAFFLPVCYNNRVCAKKADSARRRLFMGTKGGGTGRRGQIRGALILLLAAMIWGTGFVDQSAGI